MAGISRKRLHSAPHRPADPVRARIKATPPTPIRAPAAEKILSTSLTEILATPLDCVKTSVAALMMLTTSAPAVTRCVVPVVN